jgi:3-hydroxyisobutyrate dehydrogenase-like beta-hydroxyacid dehydrogenase
MNTASTTRVHRCAFLGLGVMGHPMAGHLARAGHTVTVYNRTAAKAAGLGGRIRRRLAATPREAARDAEFVFACVGNDDDLRSVVLGDDGAYAGMAVAVFVDHTTASAEVARELHAAGAGGVAFRRCAGVRRQAGAVNGQLTVMCGGDAAVRAMRPVAMAYARAVTLVGASGAGQLAKMANQICIAGLVQGLAEAIAFGQKAGLDMKQVLERHRQGRGAELADGQPRPTMVDGRFDFGFAVDWMRKDLGLVLDEARRNGARLPVTALVDQFYADMQAQGGGRWDTSSLINAALRSPCTWLLALRARGRPRGRHQPGRLLGSQAWAGAWPVRPR